MMMTQGARPDLMAALEDRGHRMTSPRRRVIDHLSDKIEGFSAEEVHDALPDVGRATVYRTIKLLVEAGVVCKLALPNGAPKYSLARYEHHHHTVCIRCGTVGEFRAATIERLIRTIGSDIPGDIIGHRIEFYICCEQCAGREDSEV